MEFVIHLLGSPVVIGLAVAIAVVFLGALLWKIIRSPEGFLFGYGNWVVGKWQSGAEAQRPLRQPAASAVAEGAEPKRDTATLKRALYLKANVLTLSRMLDGDLAYLMMHDAGDWQPKIQKALQTLVSGVTRVVHPAGRCRCGLFILDDNDTDLVLAVGEGYGNGKRPRLPLDHSCAGRAFLTGEDYYCRDVLSDPVYGHSPQGSKEFRSIACVPVRAGQAVFGVICLDAEPAGAFTAEDFAHLEVFAAKLAVFCAFHALQVGVCDINSET